LPTAALSSPALEMTQDAANVAQLPEFDEIVDVRSPSEFVLDHIPGAINCPVLDDEERAMVGTMYAHESPFAAKKAGAALVARNIARHIENEFATRPKHWRPLIYCWRGGQRSASMTIVCRQIGWDARKLAGGYKAFRRHVVAEIDRRVPDISFRVICGLTGTGKSALLRALKQRDAQVIDLEYLAAHRGSVLGNLPEEPQPSQKMFESRIWDALRGFDSSQPIYVEAESRRIGKLRVPDSLIGAMRGSPCILLNASTSARVDLLLREYAHFTQARAELFSKLDCLTELHGRKCIDRWKTLATAGDWDAFVRELLEEHYDPAYRKSTLSNYPHLTKAIQFTIDYGAQNEFAALAQRLVENSYPSSAATVERSGVAT
jgi:tRNA 2-selenouridine synthase